MQIVFLSPKGEREKEQRETEKKKRERDREHGISNGKWKER